jgi:hypothetical protein
MHAYRQFFPLAASFVASCLSPQTYVDFSLARVMHFMHPLHIRAPFPPSNARRARLANCIDAQ